jgi:hypothetical protein
MSANVEVLRSSELIGSSAQDRPIRQVAVLRESSGWNPEDFAREQIRGLVRRVFFASGPRAVRQVVFSATETHIDVASICDQVGRALALETSAPVAIVNREPRAGEMVGARPRDIGRTPIKSWSIQLGINLWRVPDFGIRACGEESGTERYWLSCLAEVRREFEYAVIEGPAAGISSEAAMLGQLADGIILVLGAHRTRRATARKIKETLDATQSRILGTVLNERRFPVPERIYRRL